MAPAPLLLRALGLGSPSVTQVVKHALLSTRAHAQQLHALMVAFTSAVSATALIMVRRHARKLRDLARRACSPLHALPPAGAIAPTLFLHLSWLPRSRILLHLLFPTCHIHTYSHQAHLLHHALIQIPAAIPIILILHLIPLSILPLYLMHGNTTSPITLIAPL